jgi:hypothetical protein
MFSTVYARILPTKLQAAVFSDVSVHAAINITLPFLTDVACGDGLYIASNCVCRLGNITNGVDYKLTTSTRQL